MDRTLHQPERTRPVSPRPVVAGALLVVVAVTALSAAIGGAERARVSSADVRLVVLAVHVTAGTAGLALGPLVALGVGAGWRARLHVAYQVGIAGVTTTALGLVALSPGRFWWLAPIAVLTQAAAAGGGWLHRCGVARPWQVRLLGGSYVSLVTALLVVNWGGWAAWVLPTLVGTLVVEAAAERARRAPALDRGRGRLGIRSR